MTLGSAKPLCFHLENKLQTSFSDFKAKWYDGQRVLEIMEKKLEKNLRTRQADFTVHRGNKHVKIVRKMSREE